ncbi:MAG TPA: hypothetical protein VFN57_14440, partial [Thermomicrobiaceae bacterium]|nr:hypothetical protein [Thermomicrobiaceae bacterium]
MPAIPDRHAGPLGRYLAAPLLRKVPAITVLFWVIKLLTTATGEATSDFLVFSINPYVAVVAGCLGLVLALLLQLRATHYVPAIYWLAVTMVAVFGTMAADVLHVALGVPYPASSLLYGLVLVAVFLTWWKVEGTL